MLNKLLQIHLKLLPKKSPKSAEATGHLIGNQIDNKIVLLKQKNQ